MDHALGETREAWPGLSTYERFEQVVSLVLTGLLSLVIAAALVNLTFASSYWCCSGCSTQPKQACSKLSSV